MQNLMLMCMEAQLKSERGQLDHVTPDLWQNDTSVARNSWGYTIGNDYKKTSDIVLDLVRCSQ